MKLCFIAGANSIHSYKWIKYFADKGHEIHWISFTPYTQDSIKNISFYFIKGSFFGKYFTLKRIIKRIRPDILHAHYAGVNGLFGALMNFHPFVLTVWGSDVLINSKSRIKKPLVKFILKKADLITCNGNPLKREIENLGINSQKIKFAYWATDISQFKPEKKNEELIKKLGILNSPIIISIRSLESVYNIDTLIYCFPIVLKEVPNTKLIIAGEGPLKAKLRDLANSLGISSSVKFTGWISHKEIPDYLNLADICVSASSSDGDLAQGTQQAMACEVLIITTDLEVNKRRIKNEINGFIFPAKDFKSLAQKIIMLLKNNEIRIKVGKKGRETIKNELNYHKEMEKVNNLYSELVKQK